MIRIWDDGKLAKDFASNTVSEREKLGYLLIYQVVILAIVTIVPFEAEEQDLADWISFSFSLLVTIGGIIWCFKSNADGKDFVARFIGLGVPAGVKTSVLAFLPLSFMIFGSYLFIGEEFADSIWENEPLMIAFGHAIEMAYLWRIQVGIRRIQRLSPNETQVI